MIADPVLADEIREDARQTFADQLAVIDDIRQWNTSTIASEYYDATSAT